MTPSKSLIVTLHERTAMGAVYQIRLLFAMRFGAVRRIHLPIIPPVSAVFKISTESKIARQVLVVLLVIRELFLPVDVLLSLGEQFLSHFRFGEFRDPITKKIQHPHPVTVLSNEAAGARGQRLDCWT